MKKFKLFALSILLAGGSFLLPSSASATGTDAVVTVEVLVNGDIEVTSTKDLSNVRIAACLDAEIVITKFDSLDDKVEVFDVNGTLIAVLAKSGNNTTEEAEDLLIELGGTVSGNSTGVIAFFDEETLENCEPSTTTTTVPSTTTTTEPPTTTTTTEPPTTTTTQPPVTTTTVPPTVPVMPPATEVPAPVADGPAAPVAAVDTLATTGIGSALAWLGLAILFIGGILWLLSKSFRTNDETEDEE